MYLARELTTFSLPKIGRAFGGMHHATVLHAVRKIESIRRTNGDVHSGLIEKLIEALHLAQEGSAARRI